MLSAVRSALRSLLTDEGGKPPTVFLSYSHEDKKIVSKVAELLRAEGIDVWIDLSGIHWGDNIAERVQRGLDSADFVAFFMSRNSLGKVWPQAELNAIISRELSSNRGPIVLPIRLDDVEIPPLLRSIKYLELRDHNVNRATKELIDTIRHHMVGRGYKDLKR